VTLLRLLGGGVRAVGLKGREVAENGGAPRNQHIVGIALGQRDGVHAGAGDALHGLELQLGHGLVAAAR